MSRCRRALDDDVAVPGAGADRDLGVRGISGSAVLCTALAGPKPTSVLPATLTSFRFAALTGSTRTVASVRSLAVTRTWAPATSTMALMGPWCGEGRHFSFSCCPVGVRRAW
jgi:hypothetical protein